MAKSDRPVLKRTHSLTVEVKADSPEALIDALRVLAAGMKRGVPPSFVCSTSLYELSALARSGQGELEFGKKTESVLASGEAGDRIVPKGQLAADLKKSGEAARKAGGTEADPAKDAKTKSDAAPAASAAKDAKPKGRHLRLASREALASSAAATTTAATGTDSGGDGAKNEDDF